MIRTLVTRAGGVAAAVTALTLGVAGSAYAHHCYKLDLNEQAYANQATNDTPWTPLSEVVELYVLPEAFAQAPAACQQTASRAVELYMDAKGLTQEPLIHAKATVGVGAKGNGSAQFGYLGNDGALLDQIIHQVGVECGAWPAAPEDSAA